MNVLKGLGGSPTRRLKLWGLKNEEKQVLECIMRIGSWVHAHGFKEAQAEPFDYIVGPTSNNNNSLNLNPNYIEFAFKINPRMSIFQ